MINNKKNKMFPIPPSDEDIHCPECKKDPTELKEIQFHAEQEEMSEFQFIKEMDGTYCKHTGLFLCTDCYIKLGMPSNKDIHEDFIYYRMDVKPLRGQDDEVLIQYRLGEI